MRSAASCSIGCTEYDGLYVLSGQLGGIYEVELFLFQRGKEAFHPGVVIAASGVAHVLHELAAPERLTE